VNFLAKQGSLGLAVFLGFITMIVLGWIPVIGSFIAGLVAGLIARGGAGRGATAGFLTGILGALIIGAVLMFLGTAFLGGLGFLVGFGLNILVILLSLVGAIIALIGGAIGGALRG
jgi:hypothetical protein